MRAASVVVTVRSEVRLWASVLPLSAYGYARASYHLRERLTTRTTDSMTGTSIKTPTTVANAAPECTPNSPTAVATASSKKLLAPISAEGPATQYGTPSLRLSK